MRVSLRHLTTAILLVSAMVLQAQTRDFSFDNTAQREGLTVEQTTRSSLTMRHTLKQLQILNIIDDGYTGDIVQGGTGITLPANPGEPNLPSISRFVAIPNGATAHIEMGYRSMTTISNVDLLPAAPILFDTDDSPNTYEKNPSIYNKNAFFPEQPVTVSEPFSLRGVQTVAVTVVPYQYNPVTKELRVYDDVQFSVRFDGGNGEFGDTRLRSPYWDPILMQNLVNYNQLPVIDYEARMQEWVNNRPTGCEYLIVIPNDESFRQYANQLRDYRIQQGILTEVKSLSDMECTTTNQMKDYFHNAYNTWEIPPVAVLLLGDHNTNMSVGIPAEYTWHSYDYGNCITDNGYADVTGDLLPEMAFSRLVAANANEAQMMVSKQLEYEYTNPNMDAASYDHPITALGWQTQRWFQICSEAVGGYWRNQGKHPVRINAIYEGYPDNIWSSNQNTSMVVNYFGPNGMGYIPASPSELGGWTGGTAAQVVQAVNSGCMLLQHRDHGYYQGWGEPDFSNSNVSQMNNTGKLTFVNTINCQTGTFDHTPECLIEAFMRRTSVGQNAGAVGCIGPTQISYSFVNDAYAWGMYDQYDPQFMPDYGPYADYEGNWRPAFGNVAGKYFLQQSSWPSNPDKKAITHKMFTAHCDAFLTLFTQVPTAMNVNHPTQISAATTNINVSAPAGAVIALTRNNNILAVATATGSNQYITFPAQPSNSDITIVATKQDRLRYVGTIHVISEPNLTLTEVVPHDANGNQQLEYGELSTLDMVIKNVGNLASSTANATLSTRTPLYVTINDNGTVIPALAPNQTTNLNEVFGITVSNAVPDGANLDFTLTMVSEGHTWTSNFTLTAYAPNLHVSNNMTINDAPFEKGNGNGRLDPGENAEITFIYLNNGRAPANNVTATLSTIEQQYINISNPTVATSTVDSGETVEVTYNVSVSTNMPKGETAQLTLNVTAGSYSDQLDFSHRVGLEIAHFENGLDDFEWQNDPEHPWSISSISPYSGQFCLQSGTIGHNQSSSLSLQFEVENETDEIRFFRKTDCAESDYLKFYLDGTQIHQWGGQLSWREMVFPVTQGEHTFTWVYEKDGNGTNGADHVYLDDILFPVQHISFSCNAGNDQDLCQVAAQLEGNVVGGESLLWTTSGDGSFDQNNIISPIYTPGEQDLTNKTVTLTLTATNENGETLSDDVIIIFHEAVSIGMNDATEICEDGIIQVGAIVNEASNVIWTTDGDGSFDHPDNISAIYTPGEQDKANGQVMLTLKAISEYGCGDAEQSMMLTIRPIQHSEFEMNSCGTYTWNGIAYNEAGDYEQTLPNIFGCDSIVVMHLNMVDNYHVVTEQASCNSYVWYDMMIVESGIYEHTFLSVNGCDSVVEAHITINDHTPVDFYVEGCDSYEWNGIIYTESGVYEQVFTNAMGCDSIVVMNLHLEYTPTPSEIWPVDINNPTPHHVVPPSESQINSYEFQIWESNPYSYWDTIRWKFEDPSVQWTLEPDMTTPNKCRMYVLNYVEDTVWLNATVYNRCAPEGVTRRYWFVCSPTDVDEHSVEAKIYPNPTQGTVTIKAQGLRHITLSNMLGQILTDQETEGDETRIDMSRFAPGTYLINIYSENGNALKRVTLIR